MRRPRPVPGVVEILQDALEHAQAGQVCEVFVLYRDREGGVTTDYYTTDVQGMAFELRTETIRLRADR